MKRSILFVALLAICFGCLEDDPDDPFGQETITGTVLLDGPIEGAVAFLDLNDDHLLNSNEPRVATDSAGSYTIDKLLPDQLSHSVVVQIRPNSVRANRAENVGFELTLESVPGRGELVSPLTALIAGEMAVDPSLSFTQAHGLVRDRLTASQIPFTGEPIDLLRDYAADAAAGTTTSPDSTELIYVSEAVAQVIKDTVSVANTQQSFVDTNEGAYFDTLMVAIDEQLTQIADGTYDFTQLTPTEQNDIADNPSNYLGYFLSADQMVDAWVLLLDFAIEVADAFFDWIDQQVAAFAASLIVCLVENVAEALIGAII